MSEKITEYIKRKEFENIIVSKLIERMEELYSIRNDIEGCLAEVNTAIKEIERDFFIVMEKVDK